MIQPAVAAFLTALGIALTCGVAESGDWVMFALFLLLVEQIVNTWTKP